MGTQGLGTANTWIRMLLPPTLPPTPQMSSEYLGTSFSFKANPDLQITLSLSLMKMLTPKRCLSDGLDHGSKYRECVTLSNFPENPIGGKTHNSTVMPFYGNLRDFSQSQRLIYS